MEEIPFLSNEIKKISIVSGKTERKMRWEIFCGYEKFQKHVNLSLAYRTYCTLMTRKPRVSNRIKHLANI